MEREKLIALVRGAQQGDSDSASELFLTYRQGIYYYLLKMTNNEDTAEDLTQETFMVMLEKLPTLQEPAAFVTWLQTIAHSRYTDFVRKDREKPAATNEEGQTVFDTLEEDRAEFIPGEDLEKEELAKAVLAMVQDLPDLQRSAILLRYYSEKSVAEIAKIQGVSEGTVKSRLNYGRKALEKSVTAYEQKHGIQLHCAGAVPLLLWLFHNYAASIAATCGTGTAVAVGVTAGAGSGAAAAGVGAAASAGSSAVGSAVAAGAKVAGKIALKKIIAAVTAAVVLAGGVTAGVLLGGKEEKEPEKKETTQWFGYGETYNGLQEFTRYDLTVAERTPEYIQGHLQRSLQYSVLHDSDFEGPGTEQADGRICYNIVFEESTDLNTLLDSTFNEISLYYDPNTKKFEFGNLEPYEATLIPMPEEDPVLIENGFWTGNGTETFDTGEDEIYFELNVHQLRHYSLYGTLRIYRNGTLDHETEVTGRGWPSEVIYGYKKTQVYYEYEIKLEDPYIAKFDMYTSRLQYNPEEDSFSVPGILPRYRFTLTRQEE